VSAAPLLFDTHCHLVDERFDADREELINGLPQKGVHACLACGCDPDTSLAGIRLAASHPHVWAAAGVHPHDVGKAVDGDLERIEALLGQGKVVAVGEIGLDFYYDFSPKDAQMEWLDRQVDLAYRHGLPVLLHVREAHGAMTDYLRARRGKLPPGVLHCFSGSAESAREYQALGFHISFAGPLTFRNAHNLHRAAAAVAPERLLVETDSPYLAPVPYRGKRNDPSLVREVCLALAQLRGVAEEEMAEQTCRNACALFKVPLPEGLA